MGNHARKLVFMVLELYSHGVIEWDSKLLGNLTRSLDLSATVGASVELGEQYAWQSHEFVSDGSLGLSLASWAVGVLDLIERCIETLFEASSSFLPDLGIFEVDNVNEGRLVQYRLPILFLAGSLLLTSSRTEH